MLARAALPAPLHVATVDHGLRPESAAEARYVAELCGKLGIRHETISLALPTGPALQERARDARYAALGDWARRSGLRAIATAHHAHDQAETLLMRLSRGAGLRGLAAMRPRGVVPGSSDCPLLRPLLGWRRSELAEIVAAAGVEPVQDPSNADLRFERVRVRMQMRHLSDLDPMGLALSARHLAEADVAIEWAVAHCMEAVRTEDGISYWNPSNVPRVIALRVLERLLYEKVGVHSRGNALARWHDRLARGEVATLAGVRGDGRKAEWRFALAPKPRSAADPWMERP